MTGHGSMTIEFPSACEITMQREFQAPMALVFDALTRTVATWAFEGRPEADAVETVTLTAAGGITTMTSAMVFKDQASRDANFGGDTQGVQNSFDYLEDLLADLV